MRGHADDFARAKAVIPPPRVFDDLQRRLQAAYAAHAHPVSMGRFSGQIADLQRLLARSGYDVGKIDGKLGLTTRAGVKQMQLKHGLPADSYPTAALLERMNGGR